MASGEEIVMLITEKVVHYVETPKAERIREHEKEKQTKEPWSRKWFGMIPLGIELWWESEPEPLWKRKLTASSVKQDNEQ
ncbi:hypothetical protein J2Z69_002296 [Paenibacillus shirakamiensis]|uniref:YqzE family protein n=1 Tax=Paenibacillus shirakamiensis TaxID=1265935 RepID=A0ABS4JHS4_9BACL|nr:YqzE family protein [Paenibacillus shirakamiensis]MBP2001253.1 hypothetical protein [Paenibacillus shirakamiensis]